jgi:hypothetical protein
VFTEDMLDAVRAVLASGRVNYWTGEEARRFEDEYAEFVGTKHAIAVANGTVAIELALYALGVGPGDDVIVPSRTFIATASAAAMRGARPVFADVDRNSQNITAETIAAVLTPRTKAVIVVHLAGRPCEMDPILRLARERNLKVIEDCAQAHGAVYKGRQVGSLGDMAAFSFCQDKIITTGGEGGLVTTNDSELWERAWSYKDHGKSWDAVYHQQHPGVFKWLHESLGTNWRMTEMQAAIGRIALQRLPEWVSLRRRNADILNAAFAGIPALRTPLPPAHMEHSYYKHYAFVRPEYLQPGWTRDRIVLELQQGGVPCGTGTCPEIYAEKAFDGTGWQPRRPLPVAHELGETSLMFVVHPTLGLEHMRFFAETTAAVMHRATQAAPAVQRRAA